MIIPGGENRFVFGKVVLVASGLAFAALAPASGRLPRAVVVSLACGFAILLVAALTSSEPFVAIVGRGPRFEGLPMIALYAGAAWSGARLLGPTPPPQLARYFVQVLSVTAVVVAFVAILQALGVHVLATDVFRSGSLLGNADDEGALGVLLFGVCAWVAIRTPEPIFVVGAAASGTLVALSGSRASLVGLAITALVLLIASPARRRLATGGAVLLVVVLTLAVPASFSRVTGSSPLAGTTTTGRLLLWEETAALIAHHPVLGVGPDNFIDAITPEHDARWQSEIGPANPPDTPQDALLQAGADGGLLLLLVVLVLVGLTVRAGWRATRPRSERRDSLVPGLFAGCAGYGVALLFGLTTPGTTPLAALCAGAILAVAPRDGPAKGFDRHGRRVVLVAAAATAVIALLAAVAEIPLERGLVAVSHGNLPAAQGDFRLAQDLRPWDVSVPQTAGHAFATEASAVTPGSSAGTAVARAANPWLAQVATHLATNEEERLDQATRDELLRRYPAAEGLLRQALRADPGNPAILLQLGIVQGESGQIVPARSTLLEASRIDPSSPAVWNDLAIVYGLEHDPTAQARAEAKAHQLG